MVFNTRDEAYYYFRVYARKKGFAIKNTIPTASFCV
jgi:hypothetical protein